MARKRDNNRFRDILEAATSIFIDKGYKRTKMEDVTRSIGLSAGSIYRYVESKEALFDLVLRFNLQDISLGEVDLPVKTPEMGGTLKFLGDFSQLEGRFPELHQITESPSGDPEQELCEIVSSIYRVLSKYRVGIQMIESCSLDWPELADIWFRQRRTQLFKELEEYMKERINQGTIAPVVNVKAAVRLLVNSIAFFAIHRHFDVLPTKFSEKMAEDTVIQIMVRAFIAR